MKVRDVPIHEEVLEAAQLICDERGRFQLIDIVKRLPHRNPATIRTQVGSYCCVNAPEHHQVRQPYFSRIEGERGMYEIVGKHRPSRGAAAPRDRPRFRSEAIHAVVHETDGMFVAECHEVPVVTQGRSLDETLRNLREAIALHLDGEDLSQMGLAKKPRLSITFEAALAP
jgi:predicted RNase H-like HicB family nuclease